MYVPHFVTIAQLIFLLERRGHKVTDAADHYSTCTSAFLLTFYST